MIKHLSLTFAALIVCAASTFAARAPQDLANEHGLHVPPTITAPRANRSLVASPPSHMRSVASAHYDSRWTILWDADTGAPSRIYGPGRSFPSSVSDPAAAEVAARGLLSDQIGLLAPGSSVSDFRLAASTENKGVRSVTFHQFHRGLRVVDGFISFRFKRDRLIAVAAETLPNVTVSDLSTPLPGLAEAAAAAWVSSDFGGTPRADADALAVILPIISRGQIAYHAALPITVRSASPIGEWTVYVAPGDRVIGRIQRLMFDGTVLYNTPDRWPGDTRSDFPAAFTQHTVDGVAQTSDALGLITFAGGTASVDTGLSGPFATISNQAGAAATTNLTVAAGGTATWSGGDVDELLDAQLTTFVHSNRAKAYARLLAPSLAWLDETMPINVNINDFCNAFSTGDSINFFIAGSLDFGNGVLDCGNTGRLVDVVYHEFGHSFHIQTIQVTGGAFDSAFSEGLSDYYAATITGDPEMGRGFFNSEEALRPIEGPRGDTYWPQGFWSIDTHYTGVIFAGAMWDLRSALIAELGETAGIAKADELFYGAVQRATDVPTTYVEVLTEDDDDGNLANGTPNQCAIDFAFGTHGLGPERSLLGPGLGLPTRDRYNISVPVRTPGNGCVAPEVGSVEIFWQLKRDTTTSGTVVAELDGDAYTAIIPRQPEGAVIQYQVTVAYADGNTRRLPLNVGLPFYEIFNGDFEEIYCTDFESDPVADGWTLAGFEHGPPLGDENNADPPAAFSGANVVGNGLDASGRYGSGNHSLTSPAIDVTGKTGVHVQFQRWLNVEDAAFDTIQVSVNGTQRYINEPGPNLAFPNQHFDHEWRLMDFDVDAEAASGSIQVQFDLIAQGSSEKEGWNIDDFCVVAFVPSVCGDGSITGNETCDDGAANSDTDPDVCRANCEPAFCGDNVTDTGEECDDGNSIDDDDCSNTCIDLDGGCGCSSGGGEGASGLLFLLVAAVMLGRRRRRRT